MRLDSYLVAHALVRSRDRAKGVIKAGRTSVNGVVVSKPSANVEDGDVVECSGDLHPYVSRAALKLKTGLEHFDLNVRDKTCLDVGASTGGFTEVLLEDGAKRVFAVDVGSDQMDPSIKNDPRVVCLENINARNLTSEHVPDPIEALVCDVSFIGLRTALGPALSLCEYHAEAVILVKPQFELGPSHIGKRGIVSMALENQVEWIRNEIVPWFQAQGWVAQDLIPSPITGGDGNAEFLLGGIKSA